MKRGLLGLLLALALSGCVRALHHLAQQHKQSGSAPSVAAEGDTPAPQEVRTQLEAVVKGGVPGVTAIVMRDGRLLYRLDVGGIDADTRYPVASASKWMTAALLMTVVDEGKLSLDEPVSKHLPVFQGTPGEITLRQLLAQTSGEGSLKDLVDIRQDPRITLAASAAEIAARPLQDPPGQVFKYGGPGFQVAGALAEAVTGQRWSELFAQRIAQPLGMTHTVWKHLPDRSVPPEQTLNPLLQGGVVTSAEDYMKFLGMLARGGTVDGRRILSTQAVEAMETAQTLGKPMAYLPPGGVPGTAYALGNWCETWNADRRCTMVSSPGAFGTFPWIDRGSGLYGIFFLRDRFPNVSAQLLKARAAIIAATPPVPASAP